MKRLCLLCSALLVLQTSCADEPTKQRGIASLPLLRAYPTFQIGTTDPDQDASAIDTVMHDGEQLVIRATPIFTEQQVDKIEEMPIPNAMGFWLDESGSRALSDYTQGAIQKRMAIRFGERWVGFPSVRSEIKNGRFAIFDLTEEEKTVITAAFGSAAD